LLGDAIITASQSYKLLKLFVNLSSRDFVGWYM